MNSRQNIMPFYFPNWFVSDVDECKAKTHCHGGDCKNTVGSFNCYCPPGFDLSSDGKQCLGNSLPVTPFKAKIFVSDRRLNSIWSG